MSILIGLFGRPVTGCLYFMCCRFMSLACARGKSIKKQNKNRSLLRLSVQYFASSQAPLPVHSLASHRPVRAPTASCESLRRAHARLMCVAHDGMLAVRFSLSSTTLIRLYDDNNGCASVACSLAVLWSVPFTLCADDVTMCTWRVPHPIVVSECVLLWLAARKFMRYDHDHYTRRRAPLLTLSPPRLKLCAKQIDCWFTIIKS